MERLLVVVLGCIALGLWVVGRQKLKRLWLKVQLEVWLRFGELWIEVQLQLSLRFGWPTHIWVGGHYASIGEFREFMLLAKQEQIESWGEQEAEEAVEAFLDQSKQRAKEADEVIVPVEEL